MIDPAEIVEQRRAQARSRGIRAASASEATACIGGAAQHDARIDRQCLAMFRGDRWSVERVAQWLGMTGQAVAEAIERARAAEARP